VMNYSDYSVIHPSEISAFKNEVFEVLVSDIESDPFPDLDVIISLPDNQILEATTNTSGIASFNIYTETEGVAEVDIPAKTFYNAYNGNFDVIINYSEYSVIHISSIYGYKNETFSMLIKDLNTGDPLPNVSVIINLPDGQELEAETNTAGIAIFDIYTETEGIANIDILGSIISSVVYSDYSSSFDIVINEMIVEHTDDLGVLREGNIELSVKQGPIYPVDPGFLPTPLSDAIVSISNALDISYSGITGATGIITTNGNTSYTKKVDIEVTKETYRTYTETIEPYIWSNDKNAFGENNQNSILRKASTNIMHMVYSDGDSIVYGCSDDFGKYWYLEKIGRGINPTIVKTETGLIAMWNYSTNIEYSILSSPWTPIDTVSLPVCWKSEPTLTGAKSSPYKYGAYIGYRHLPSHKGDLIFGKWIDDALVNLEIDTVFRADGSIEGIIPKASPIT
ncbi:hypothetical protein KAU15_06975, partial [candidate division WOR-3 bacterium]|nr:hypothetical protein [candidate division WOR-3 bacterium]